MRFTLSRRTFLAMATLAAIVPRRAWPQQKRAVVGILGTGSATASPHIYAAFKERMRSLGWNDGRNVEYLELVADGYVERLDGLALEMVRRKVDVIVAGPPPSAVAAHKATRSIPIVMANVPDPVALGLVANLARPGGNVTGVSSQTTALVGKEIELLKEIVPGVKRIGVLVNPKNPNAGAFRAVAEKAAASLGLRLEFGAAERPEALEQAVQRLATSGVRAIVVPADPMMLGERRRLNEAIAKAGLPAAFGNRDHATDGGLVSYAPDILANFRLAAGYVDRILRGANPAQMPVEQSDTIQLIVNLKTAKTLGIVIPRAVLARADEVIE
jgi:putative tryptophan/tyrosine transport system substrate-binding protein